MICNGRYFEQNNNTFEAKKKKTANITTTCRQTNLIIPFKTMRIYKFFSTVYKSSGAHDIAWHGSFLLRQKKKYKLEHLKNNRVGPYKLFVKRFKCTIQYRLFNFFFLSKLFWTLRFFLIFLWYFNRKLLYYYRLLRSRGKINVPPWGQKYCCNCLCY